MSISKLKQKKDYSYDVVPNELLERILKPLLLKQRIGLRSVSTRFKAVLEDDLKKETRLDIQFGHCYRCFEGSTTGNLVLIN